MENLRVAICQLNSIDDVTQNLKQIIRLLENFSKKDQVRLIAFPENCLFMRLTEGGEIQTLNIQHEALKELSYWARKLNSYIHLGSVAFEEKGKVYNQSLIISDTGNIVPSYRKIHLFDIQLENALPIRESDRFFHGSKPETFSVDGWLIGQSICYDLRFSELFSFYARLSVDLVLVPSAFLFKTGEAHWHVLLRARAIESQCYVVAAAQGGIHKGVLGTRETYGRSLAVDPWGKVLGEIHQSPGQVIIDLKKSQIKKVRDQIPMAKHRRL